jgi:flagellar hook assembly protein FlgD
MGTEVTENSPCYELKISNFPNPFNPQTTISFNLYMPDQVCLKIYNVRGKLIKTLTDEQYVPGKYQIAWDGTNSNYDTVSSGIYLYNITTSNESITKTMLLLK